MAVNFVVPETCVTVWVMWMEDVASKCEVTTYGSPTVPVPVSAGAEVCVNGTAS